MAGSSLQSALDEIWPGYTIDRKIGSGSYGSVYRITRKWGDVESERALKIIDIPQDLSEVKSLRMQGWGEQSIRSHFEATAQSIANETKAMEILKSVPQIVQIDDSKLIENSNGIGWTIWIQMELLESLADYCGDHGLPSQEETVRIGKDICKALEVCHKRRIIHRDVKPENVFRRPENSGYALGDFGVARRLEGVASSALSRKGAPQYMAPEEMRGNDYGPSVDIYALGIMLYRFLNGGRFPFMPENPDLSTYSQLQEESLQRRINGEQLPRPSEADEQLADIVLTACDADPRERFATATEMLNALEAWRPMAIQDTIHPAPQTIEDKSLKDEDETFDGSSTPLPLVVSPSGFFPGESKTVSMFGFSKPVNHEDRPDDIQADLFADELLANLDEPLDTGLVEERQDSTNDDLPKQEVSDNQGELSDIPLDSLDDEFDDSLEDPSDEFIREALDINVPTVDLSSLNKAVGVGVIVCLAAIALSTYVEHYAGAWVLPLILTAGISGLVLLNSERRTVFGVLAGAIIALIASAVLGITPVLYCAAAVCGGIAIYTAVSR